MEGKEKYLPIGTVVVLKEGTKKLMITSYLVFHSTDGSASNFINGTAEVFDYGACLYPEGILDANTSFAFNHEQIDTIIYMGCESEDQKELSHKLIEGYKILKEQMGRTN